MNYGTKQKISGLLKALGLTALFAIGMSESETPELSEEEKIANYQLRHGCTEEQVEKYKRDHIPPTCLEQER